MPNPQLLPEEEFEDLYMAKFEDLVRRRGLLVKFARDRAALDVGIMLTGLGTLELSGRKIWFQLKGVHRATVSADDIVRTGHVAISVKLDHLRFWYAAPEATYLVVYVEAIDQLLAEDVRDLVDRRWGPNFLAPGFFGTQETITVHVSRDAVLDERLLDSMVAHRSMRIDGPAFRDRPLGHRLDPLLCALAELNPDVFESVVADLLKAHQFINVTEHDSTRLLAAGTGQRVRVLTGTLFTTYEYPFSMSVEIGFGADIAPRREGQFFSALGRVVVVVHSRVAFPFHESPDAPAFLDELAAAGFERVLVFANAPEFELLAAYRSLLGQRCDVPQGLGSIAYNVLVATLVYLHHQEHLRWDHVNFQLEVDAEPFSAVLGTGPPL